jgi:ribosomal protein L27
MIPQAMLKITEIVKDDILEIVFSDKQHISKSYTIMCERGTEIMKGKIAGFTQRTCLYIGELKKGKYQFQIDQQNATTFEVI